ncbi:MAG: mandelate racemase/muconate lactonizing enzyme family protein [Bryobacter sp.]|nr:mandelate racemase/muconate lactonizing enzyme family protein [Bryobacter sp.]
MPLSRRRLLALPFALPALSLSGFAQDKGFRVRTVETFRHAKALAVKLTCENGAYGWGETSSDNPAILEAIVHEALKEEIIGQNAFDAEPNWDRMFYANHDSGPGGALANAIAGIDIAAWDLRGRALKLPVSALIGGRYRERVKVYGSFGVGFGKRLTTDQAAAQARKFVDKGYRAVKVRMQIRENRQNPDPDPTFDYVRAVRSAIGKDVELLVDINNGYTVQRAIEVGLRLNEEFSVRYYEEPASDQYHEESAKIAAALPRMAIIAGEKEYTRWQLRSLIVHGDVDYLNPDVVKAGGITEMKKIAAMAQAFEKQIICHNTRPVWSTAATLHLMASISNAGPFMEYPDEDEFASLLALVQRGFRYADGYLSVPTTPGLGVEVDEAALRKNSVVKA